MDGVDIPVPTVFILNRKRDFVVYVRERFTCWLLFLVSRNNFFFEGKKNNWMSQINSIGFKKNETAEIKEKLRAGQQDQ